MEEKIGLINGIECKFAKTDPLLIESVSKRTGISLDKAREMMRYNVFTMNQYSQLTGKAISTITNMARPNYKDGVLVTELDFCFPFSDTENKGQKFIVRNSKSEKYLKA
jgi:hypothetical protein